MAQIEALRRFLLTYPQWNEGNLLFVDYTDGVPGNAGLFPQGLEELRRREDLLGNLYVDYRLHFALYRVAERQEDGAKNARWLLDFQNWLGEQSRLGLAPRFGDVPLREQLRAEKGCLTRERPGRTGLYAVELTADFTKYYEVNDYGKN